MGADTAALPGRELDDGEGAPRRRAGVADRYDGSDGGVDDCADRDAAVLRVDRRCERELPLRSDRRGRGRGGADPQARQGDHLHGRAGDERGREAAGSGDGRLSHRGDPRPLPRGRAEVDANRQHGVRAGNGGGEGAFPRLEQGPMGIINLFRVVAHNPQVLRGWLRWRRRC